MGYRSQMLRVISVWLLLHSLAARDSVYAIRSLFSLSSSGSLVITGGSAPRDSSNDVDSASLTVSSDNTSFIETIHLTREQISSHFVVKNITQNSDLTALILRGCYMESTSASECLKAAFDRDLPHLTHVVLSQIGLDDIAFKNAVARNVTMPLSNRLHSLDLSHNPLGEKSIRHLASIIARIPQLQELKLNGIKINTDCLRSLAQALRKHEGIRKLSLVGCSLTDETMDLLTVLLKSSGHIEYLDISQNKITPEGLSNFADMVKAGGCKSLLSLNLSYNPIGDLGILGIARCLEINHLPSLRTLVLREIGASGSALSKLLLAFQGVDSLIEVLDISGNYFLPPRKVKKKKLSYKTAAPLLKNAFESNVKTAMTSLENIRKSVELNFERQAGLSSVAGKRNIPVVPALKYRKANKNLNRNPEPELKKRKKKRKKKLKKGVESRVRNKKRYTDYDNDDVDDVIDIKVTSETQQRLVYEKDLRRRNVRAIASFLQSSRKLRQLKLCRTGIDDLMCIEMVKLASKTLKQKKREIDVNDARGEGYIQLLELHLNNITDTSRLELQEAANQFVTLS